MAETDFVKKEELPTLPEAPAPEYVDVGRETPVEQLRNNVEEMIKQAGIPFDEIIAEWIKIGEAEKLLRANGKLHDFKDSVMESYLRVQKSIGRSDGYKAALAQAVVMFVQQQERERRGS